MWFSDQAEAAARHYVSIFPLSRITAVLHSACGEPGGVRAVDFDLDGEPFRAVNLGPARRVMPSLSLVVHCDTQEEIDRYWTRLSEGGRTHRGGWIHDRFGVRWQIVPGIVAPLLENDDTNRARRAVRLLSFMHKPDIGRLGMA
jgi:predicted 3-demethylubiquinone-9 3-methyltransferase (glyoxalase superfamily)